MTEYLSGLLVGLAYVAPIGLQNLFVINTALTQKKSRVYLTALIVSFFDISLALICFFGIGTLIIQWKIVQMALLLVGSIVVVWIGIGLLRAHDTMDTSTKVDVPILKVITTACVVTWFNPQAIIDGTMLFGTTRTTLPLEDATHFIMGSSSASLIWFFGISTILSIFNAKFTDKVLRVINVVCGVVIIFYGVKLFINFIQLVMA